MAKKGGSGKHYQSKGELPNISKEIRKAVRRDYMASNMRIINQLDAMKKGKRVVFTIPNPNPNETNKRFIKKVVN